MPACLAHKCIPRVWPACLPAHSQGLAPLGISAGLIRVRGKREEHLQEAAEAFLLPFRLSPACAPEAITVGTAAGRHHRPPGAGRLGSLSGAELLPEKGRQQTAEAGEVQGAYGGVVAATGARLVAGKRAG